MGGRGKGCQKTNPPTALLGVDASQPPRGSLRGFGDEWKNVRVCGGLWERLSRPTLLV